MIGEVERCRVSKVKRRKNKIRVSSHLSWQATPSTLSASTSHGPPSSQTDQSRGCVRHKSLINLKYVLLFPRDVFQNLPLLYVPTYLLLRYITTVTSTTVIPTDFLILKWKGRWIPIDPVLSTFFNLFNSFSRFVCVLSGNYLLTLIPWRSNGPDVQIHT